MEEPEVATFDAAMLARLDREDEVDIETVRAAGGVRRTTIWIVVANGVPYVRSVRGERGVWYREIRAQPVGAIHVGQQRIPVRAVLADDRDSVAACSSALPAKYGNGPSTVAMLAPDVLGTTLRLEPA
jgi:hypothetical protein